jgi:hypothetical protein
LMSYAYLYYTLVQEQCQELVLPICLSHFLLKFTAF